MEREEIKVYFPYLKAFAEGKEIQCDVSGEWRDTEVISLSIGVEHYRIKPAPKYRPFKSQEECWQEMHKHPDFGWIMTKDKKELIQIGRVFTSRLDNVMITLGCDEGHNFNASHCLGKYRFTDNTPFGIKEE